MIPVLPTKPVIIPEVPDDVGEIIWPEDGWDDDAPEVEASAPQGEADSVENKHISRLGAAADFLVAVGITIAPLARWSWLDWQLQGTPEGIRRAGRLTLLDKPEMATIIGIEVSLMMLACGWLAIRGWDVRGIGYRASQRLSLVGVGLFLFGLLSQFAVACGIRIIDSHLAALPNALHALDSPMDIAALALNSFYEEIIVVGFVALAAHRMGIAGAGLAISVILRLSYHTYQGPAAVTAMIPAAVASYLIYQRWRSLWPLVLAHTAHNVAVSFMPR